MYRVARLRCPTLSIQPWLKTLADLHGTAFRPYSTQQFSTCFDKALGRDAPDWRLKNGCPACTYKLEGEMKLIFEMLVTMDGNDSLKRYDIGCGFATTIKNSPIGEKARRLNLRALVGAFHGHAHNRMCQLRFLTTYVRG
ncbi:hypothetical protein B0H13DRAFT_2243338 [Mycena leptocephala]|nr:hypothetical protein B0H13DRAFT_2243338 [Mycena leptocephala]